MEIIKSKKKNLKKKWNFVQLNLRILEFWMIKYNYI